MINRATNTFSIRELTAKAHLGYIGAPFPEFGGSVSKQAAAFARFNIFNVNESQSLGKPYFMTLTVQAGKEITEFPNEPLVTIYSQKTIVETPTVGEERKGTVKEFISTEDYQIDIKGIIMGSGTYPAEEVKSLNELYNKNEALDVVGNLFFDLFNIQRIVLTSIKFDEMMGQQELQKYTITAVSDQDFFAELNERNNFLKG
ncbi:DUF6046 domain-containing protein [Sphingobacterium siyangense]|uniref:DUF6046 domain-containing protein n=1 Tax=Sphingobacterium siyangense TaxID=459529 RepID=UPI003DA6C090